MSNLIGLHDREAAGAAAHNSWIVDTIALSANPAPPAYDPAYHWIGRLNYGYGSTGTLPLPGSYQAFAQSAASYVGASQNCRRWIIGNEPNLSREWPNHQPIYPWNYADAYKLCRRAIRALPGHEGDEVLIAGSGPWNDELKYGANRNGDWITYFTDILAILAGAFDGFALHAYTHGLDPALVTSTARMDPPFQNRYYHFRTYQDYAAAIAPAWRHLPAYITESNGNGPWAATGLMPAMLNEIDHWNQINTPAIHCVALYRYTTQDENATYAMQTKPDVMAEYEATAAIGFTSPAPGSPTPTPPPTEPTEPTPTPTPPPTEGSADGYLWDARLTARGCTVTPASAAAGAKVWRLTVGKWFDEDEAGGRVNIYMRVLDEGGALAVGVPITQFWSSGSATKPSEAKSDPFLQAAGLGAPYSGDFGMTNLAPSYGVVVDGDHASDKINGCGLGSLEEPNYKIHTSYFFEWRLMTEGSGPTPPTPTPGALTHPLPGSVITQHFYQHPEDYAALGLPGHDGTDLGGPPAGAPIVSIADGVVAFVGVDANYGNYCRVEHSALGVYSFYAHCQAVTVRVGQSVIKGQPIALLGSTGNSTGPHLHLEIRRRNPDGSYNILAPMPSGRVDPETWAAFYGLKL